MILKTKCCGCEDFSAVLVKHPLYNIRELPQCHFRVCTGYRCAKCGNIGNIKGED